MIRYIFKRLLMIIPIVVCVAILIFTIMYFCPGDPTITILGPQATPESQALLRTKLGLDDSYIIQMGRYLYNLFIKLDLGTSYVTGRPVIEEIATRFPTTLVFAVAVMILQFLIGTPLGIMAATHQNGWADRLCMLLALVGISIPNFWLAIELMILFSLNLGILPAVGIGTWQSWILPIFCNALFGIAMQTRQTRSGMLECIRADYVTTARAKGFKERTVLYKYALPNAMIPLIQTMGDGFGFALGGTVVIENVFSIPGLGTYITQGVSQRDYPVVQGSVVILAIAFSLIMLLVDLAFAFIDPRIKARYESRNKQLKWGRRKNSHG